MSLAQDSERAFPAAVYARRIEAVRQECQAQGLDGVLLYDQASLYYLFGYDQLGYWVFQVVYLPADPELPVGAICRAPDEGMIRATGLIDDVRVWFDDSDQSPGSMVVNLVRDRALTVGARVGAELKTHCLLPAYHDDVRRHLEATIASLVDASDIVANLRVVKDESEIERFRDASLQLVQAMAAARDAIALDTPETEIHRAVVDTLYRMGGDPPALPPPIASGPRTATQTHGAATQRLIRPGDPVVVEIGASSARYHAVGANTFVLGSPTPEVQSSYAKMHDALEWGFDAFTPGDPIADASRRVQARLEALGVSRAGRHVGYGTGIGFAPTWLENLRIKQSEPRAFAPGMTFFYFIGLPLSDGGSIYIGEPVLITSNGYERTARPDYSTWTI